MHKISILIALLFLTPLQLLAATLDPPDPIIILLDKKQQQHLLQHKSLARHGRGSSAYSLKTDAEAKILYSVEYDPVTGDCGETPEKEAILGFKKATVIKKLSFSDVNKDGCIDIIFDVKEQNCSTHETEEYKKIFLCTQNGFVEKTSN